MPEPLGSLIFIAGIDKTFAPWRRIFQEEARTPGVPRARGFGSDPAGGLVDKIGIIRPPRFG